MPTLSERGGSGQSPDYECNASWVSGTMRVGGSDIVNWRPRVSQLSRALVLTLAVPCALWAADPLAEVRALYASAAYEDTLALLSKVDDPALQDAVDEYRALCLLALNRGAAAEEAIAGMVRRRPQAPDDLGTRAPKFVALYQNVRTRLLPTLATSAYAEAKATFDAGDFTGAARQFREALVLLRAVNNDRAGAIPAADFETLAGGFLSLAEQRLAAVHPAVTAKAPVARAVKGAVVSPTAERAGSPAEAFPEGLALLASAPPDALPAATVTRAVSVAARADEPAPFPPTPRVFDATDLDVTPPIVVEQRLPPWIPPHELLRQRRFTGRVEVIVGIDGRVVSAEIIRPSHNLYDDLVLEATKQWLYQPAFKREYPVQFRRVIEYVLKAEEAQARR